MKALISAFVSGLIFALGLAVSGMTNPSNVIGFLDVTGDWKPALMFLMVGAIAIYATALRWILRRQRPVFESEFHVPKISQVDRKLVIGSGLFGIGWGLVGFCPGPALMSVAAGWHEAIIFTGFKLLGLWLQSFFQKQKNPFTGAKE